MFSARVTSIVARIDGLENARVGIRLERPALGLSRRCAGRLQIEEVGLFVKSTPIAATWRQESPGSRV